MANSPRITVPSVYPSGAAHEFVKNLAASSLHLLSQYFMNYFIKNRNEIAERGERSERLWKILETSARVSVNNRYRHDCRAPTLFRGLALLVFDFRGFTEMPNEMQLWRWVRGSLQTILFDFSFWSLRHRQPLTLWVSCETFVCFGSSD